MPVPTLVISATGSNTGKTTVSCAVACALAARGVDVRLFKAGPDYLDPTFHTAALGRPARNLDGWMTPLSGLADAFARGTADIAEGGIAIVEGMMGLFDGRSTDSLTGSTAELASLLGAPVVLVVDAGGMARSAVAVVEGFANHAPDASVQAVIFNRVGSAGHTALLTEAMAAARTPRPVRVLGGLPRNKSLFLPSRHLGLMAAAISEPTRTEAARQQWRAALAAWAEENLDLDALLSVATPARLPPGRAAPSVAAAVVRLGIAQDEAFHFYYPDNLDLLREAGAELVPVSPLRDAALPGDLDGLYIGGGYPEDHAARLSENASFRASVRRFAEAGRPVYGECGGLMYLGEALIDSDGVRHPMVGALPVTTAMEPALRSLGYREVTTRRETILGPAGTVFRGHEFHYSGVTEAAGAEPAYTWTGWRGEGSGGHTRRRVLASYIHAHWGSNPDIPRALVAACARQVTSGCRGR